MEPKEKTAEEYNEEWIGQMRLISRVEDEKRKQETAKLREALKEERSKVIDEAIYELWKLIEIIDQYHTKEGVIHAATQILGSLKTPVS